MQCFSCSLLTFIECPPTCSPEFCSDSETKDKPCSRWEVLMATLLTVYIFLCCCISHTGRHHLLSLRVLTAAIQHFVRHATILKQLNQPHQSVTMCANFLLPLIVWMTGHAVLIYRLVMQIMSIKICTNVWCTMYL